MAKTNIGRVSVVPKDEYSSTENYKRLDVVSDNGSMYISKKDNNQGNPLTDKNWWFKAVEKGEVGPQGEKPVNGVDYNTPEEKEEFKNDVVNKATEEVEKNIADIEDKAIKNYNDNATQKTTEYDTNASNKLKTYNDNTTEKLKEYNDNASSKVEEYNTNANTQTETFNTNASTKTTEFDTNATNKTNAFNENYDEKLADINEASTSIEQERVISNGKYARALKTPVTDVESTQIYAENDVVDDLVINGAELTQETREGYNEIQNEIETSSMGGIDITRNSDGSVTLNGTATENIKLFYSTKEIILNGTYIFYLYGKNEDNINLQGTENGSGVVYLAYSSLSKKYVKRVYDTDTILSAFYSYIATGKTFNNETFYPMITKGEEVKPYEQYGASPSLDFPSEVQVASEQNITINETNITIPSVNSAIGQYTDTINRENNVQNKVIQELTLTGNEDFKNATYEPGEGFYAYYIKLNMLKLKNIKTFCNYFKQHNEAGNIQEECFTIPNTGNIVFIVQNYTTIEEFKTKLQELYEAGKPVKIYYVSETIDKIPLSEEVKQELDKFELYDDLNNVSIDNGTLSFKYNKSLLKVLEEKDEKIDDLQSQIDEIKTLLSTTSTASLLLENLANDNESEVS